MKLLNKSCKVVWELDLTHNEYYPRDWACLDILIYSIKSSFYSVKYGDGKEFMCSLNSILQKKGTSKIWTLAVRAADKIKHPKDSHRIIAYFLDGPALSNECLSSLSGPFLSMKQLMEKAWILHLPGFFLKCSRMGFLRNFKMNGCWLGIDLGALFLQIHIGLKF